VKNYQLTGEFECKLDAKGRIRLPSTLLRQLGEAGVITFVVNRGFEKCLMLYPKDVWDKKAAEVNQLNIYNTRQRNFKRYFYRGATKLATDTADRVLVPKSLLEYAGAGKEVVLFAYHEQIEIWSKESYNQMLQEEPDEFAELADDVFGFDKSEGESDEVS
jgi:MraZ protein